MTGEPEKPNFPIADVEQIQSSATLLVRLSRLWWLTAVCLLLAVYLAWKSLPAGGPTIRIHFPEGHGLKEGDSLRHRGIDIGVVSEVALKSDLSAITATVVLSPGAADVAGQGTRFWIVRPQLSLVTGLKGLETAVGSKYIALSPGDAGGRRQFEFEGLGSPPPDETSGGGMDIILRGEQRYGISIGSPVTWRGVDVGSVLTVNLSPDARFVDVHIRVDSAYSRLLRNSSKFWVNSGLGVDVGLSGVKISADSLTAIIRGGVSFATPSTPDDGIPRPIQSGHIFTLYSQVKAEWLSTASTIPLIDVALPQTVTVSGSRQSSIMGIARNKPFVRNALLLGREAGAALLLTAADGIADATAVMSPATEHEPATLSVTVSSAMHGETVAVRVSEAEIRQTESGATAITIPRPDADWPLNNAATLRVPIAPEECCIARSVSNNGTETSVIQSVGRHQLEISGDQWKLSLESTDLSAWHGSPVVAMSDGCIIGVFLAAPHGSVIAPLTDQLIAP